MKKLLWVVVAVLALAGLTALLSLKRTAALKTVASKVPSAGPAASPTVAEPTPPPPTAAPSASEAALPQDLVSPVETAATDPGRPPTKDVPLSPMPKSPVPPGKPPIQDPTARAALVFVGLDPVAEAYWYEAINDPTLSAHERQDLIEDLNEEGFSDPKHPTLADLPLILSRISLIEAVGFDAMDQVNADAFQEAYKDLVNLADLTVGRGQPVK